ncbi:MAG: SDR family oxidoreductase [Nitrosopumilaceae archaeon]
MKIFVVGGSGVIGSKIVKHFLEINVDTEFTYLTNKTTFGKGHILDITQKDTTVELISKINPDVIVHTTALTNVDLCETNKALANSINVEGTANVVEGCKKSNSKIVYVSTSFVFDGSKQQYFEDDTPSPTTYYGITKFRGEEIVRHSGLPYLILRTDQPYCWTEKWQHTNSVLRTINTLQSGKMHKEVVDWYNTPTYVPDFVHATAQLINDNITGIFHLTGSDFINRYDWSIITANIFGLNTNLIQPITADNLNLPVKRVNVNLANQKLHQKIGIKMSGVKKGATKMFEQKP